MSKPVLATLFVGMMIGFGSCEKETTDSPVCCVLPIPPKLEVTFTGDVHIGQPITFKLASAPASANINWTITPNNATITTNGNTASISFQAAGNYMVTGTTGTAIGASSVTVDSINYLPVNGTTVAPFNSGEQLKITAQRNDSSATASGLTFTMQTVGSYSCQNSVLSFTSINGNGAATYAINIAGIGIPLTGCSAGSSKPSGSASTKVPLPTGTTTLTIGFNGTVYTGSIVKTGNSYSIYWNYTSGVTISPVLL